MKSSDSNLRHILADNLRRLRREQGLSQEALADLASLHRTFVGAVERTERNISLDNIGKLAAALQVSPAVLLSEVGQ
jgi:transcriptional regulator with XRE-family HTH domain